MKSRFLALALIAAAFVTPAFAHEHIDPATGENVTHYQGVKPKDKADALKVLIEKQTVITSLATKPKLADSDLESIHEATYSLENSVDLLRTVETDANRSKLDELDEAVQALHSHSENHEEAASREWVAKLVTANEGVQNAF